MIVHWVVPSLLAPHAGGQRTFDQELPAEANTLEDALNLLSRAFPKLVERITDDRGRVREHVNVFVQGEMVRRGLGLQTPLGAGDEIVVLHAVSGGR